MPSNHGFTAVQLPRDFPIAPKGTWAIEAGDGAISFWADRDYRRVFQNSGVGTGDTRTDRAISQRLLDRIEAMEIPTVAEPEPEPAASPGRSGRPVSAWPTNPAAPLTSQMGRLFVAMWAAYKLTPDRPLEVADIRPYSRPEDSRQLSARFAILEKHGFAKRVPRLGNPMRFELTTQGIERGLMLEVESTAAPPGAK